MRRSSNLLERQCRATLASGGFCRRLRTKDKATCWMHDPSRCARISCVVCLNQSVHKPVRRLACGHEFHASCLRKWMSHDPSCPLCRDDLTAEYTKDTEWTP